jgi:hypothetical protein
VTTRLHRSSTDVAHLSKCRRRSRQRFPWAILLVGKHHLEVTSTDWVQVLTAQADCPQKRSAADPSNVSWQLSGDPLSLATVSFDQESGMVTVQGNFNMTAKYYVQG